MNEVIGVWSAIWARFWVVPATIVIACLGLAAFMTEVDKNVSRDFLNQWQLWFGAGADGSRAMLSAVATSIITVASVTFSITMLALSQTATQYSPRLLRNFMKNRSTQVALGVFLGVFGYCLVVLRTINGGDEQKFVPAVSVTAGGVLALAAVGVFVFFIHHIANSLQPSNIMQSVFTETLQAIERVYPQTNGSAQVTDDGEPQEPPAEKATPIHANSTGYVASIDIDRLLNDAVTSSGYIRALVRMGDFVISGQTIAVLHARGGHPKSEDIPKRFTIRRNRAIEQDPEFGIQQLVDIALRALSPGVNDPTTAVMSMEYLSAILARLGGSSLGWVRYCDKREEARLDIPAPAFTEYVGMSFGAIRSFSSSAIVMARIADAVARIGETTSEMRRRDLAQLLSQLSRASAGIDEPDDKSLVEDSIRRAHSSLARRFD